MVAGDIFTTGVVNLAPGSVMNMMPDPVAEGPTAEVIVHNISHQSDACLEYYDELAEDYVIVDTHIGQGAWMGMFLHCNYDRYYRVRNISSGANNVCCDGVQTK